MASRAPLGELTTACTPGHQPASQQAPLLPTPRPRLPTPRRAHLTATMCFATAAWPSRSVSQARTVRALSMVSAVVKVLETMTTRVASGSRPRSALTASTGSTLARKDSWRPAACRQGVVCVCGGGCACEGRGAVWKWWGRGRRVAGFKHQQQRKRDWWRGRPAKGRAGQGTMHCCAPAPGSRRPPPAPWPLARLTALCAQTGAPRRCRRCPPTRRWSGACPSRPPTRRHARALQHGRHGRARSLAMLGCQAQSAAAPLCRPRLAVGTSHTTCRSLPPLPPSPQPPPPHLHPPTCEGLDLVQHRPNLWHHVGAAVLHHGASRRAQRGVQHRPALCGVDVGAAKHGLDLGAHPRRARQLQQQLPRRRGERLLGCVFGWGERVGCVLGGKVGMGGRVSRGERLIRRFQCACVCVCVQGATSRRTGVRQARPRRPRLAGQRPAPPTPKPRRTLSVSGVAFWREKSRYTPPASLTMASVRASSSSSSLSCLHRSGKGVSFVRLSAAGHVFQPAAHALPPRPCCASSALGSSWVRASPLTRIGLRSRLLSKGGGSSGAAVSSHMAVPGRPPGLPPSSKVP